jgi:hypothetical protein
MDTNRDALRSKSAALIAGLSLVFTPTLLPAHHALDKEFDTKKMIALTGSVTKVEWSNPHVRLFLDVQDRDRAGNWELDMGSPNIQMMNGWRIDTYRPGDRVTVIAYPARNGTMLAYGSKISRK